MAPEKSDQVTLGQARLLRYFVQTQRSLRAARQGELPVGREGDAPDTFLAGAEAVQLLAAVDFPDTNYAVGRLIAAAAGEEASPVRGERHTDDGVDVTGETAQFPSVLDLPQPH